MVFNQEDKILIKVLRQK